MPRNVRNFWLELSVDGSQKQIATGPRAADGGFSLTVFQRAEGSIVSALQVRGWIDGEGVIRLDVHPKSGEMVRIETKR